MNSDTVTSDTYVKAVSARLKGYFNFEDVPEELEPAFCVWAHCTITDEKYFMTRKMNLYTVNSHQYMGLGIFDCVTPEELETYFAKLIEVVTRFGASESTMSTDYTIALISKSAVDKTAIQNTLKHLRKNQGFLFGLRGWADLGLVVVDLENREVFTNPFASEQLTTSLWSFDGKAIKSPKKSIWSRLPIFRCSCTG